VKRAVLIIAVFVILVLFVNPNIPAEGHSQYKNNPFMSWLD